MTHLGHPADYNINDNKKFELPYKGAHTTTEKIKHCRNGQLIFVEEERVFHGHCLRLPNSTYRDNEHYVLKDVTFKFNQELDLIYLTGREGEDSEVYIPIYVKENIQPKWIEDVQKNICAPLNTKKFNLVIRDSDTTHVIFRVSDGLVPPLSPEDVKNKRKEEEEKEVMSSELKKMLPDLYKTALSKRTEL